jgi:DNA-binding NtrC family response regulator
MLLRALVVEDDSKTREALRRIMESEGFEVDTADNGEDAIDFLTGGSYRLIIVDVVLPKVSGTAVLEYMQSIDPQILHNVIVVTGVGVDEIRKLFPTVYQAMGKPVLPARLRNAVRKNLGWNGSADAVAS